MAHSTQVDAAHVAELVGLAAYCRAVLGRAREHAPSIETLRLVCTHQSEGLAVIECELVDAQDMAHAGFAL